MTKLLKFRKWCVMWMCLCGDGVRLCVCVYHVCVVCHVSFAFVCVVVCVCVCVYVCMRMKRLKFRKRSYVEDPALSHPYPPLLPPLSRTHTREAHTRWIRSGSQFVKSTQNWPRFREVVRFQGHMKRHIIFPAFFFLFSEKFFLPQPPPRTWFLHVMYVYVYNCTLSV